MQSLPLLPLRERTQAGVRQVYDPLRRQWMVWTPEEHVRQCLILFLTETLGYPAALIGVERGISYHQLRKRWDLLIHDRAGQPLVLAECKEPRVNLTQETVLQLVTYNSQVNAPHLLMTNGKVLLFLSKDEKGEFALQAEVPPASALLG